MASLNYFLDRTEQSIRSIQSQTFASPGIFTNAVVKKPNIMALLKDPTSDERSLYKISKPRMKTTKASTEIRRRKRAALADEFMEIKPERVDGKSTYVDRSFYGVDNAAETNEEKEEVVKRTVVQLPELSYDFPAINKNVTHSNVPSSPTKSGIPTSNAYFALSSPEEADPSKLIDQVLTLLQKYPTLIVNQEGIMEKLNAHQTDYVQLQEQINQLENEIETQKKQLNILNINYNDITSPIRSESSGHMRTRESFEDEIDIDEYIAKEEQEIEELENQLNERQKI
ncbi:predicted protein [Scheffersomyces stipitis CBS 6054]|uniref:DASH complex subunit SPC34 n=1 Tax=Scheffersomyces stipitis (strain ATCC 58785 / CBS 6054 / NBRC 10063 / NRRL Y-11545) TaxID=322104 RepID=A3LS69_PICST|nr:predicted protein [Scheffersomyces stipitis CBS 6054]ABN65516.2 predicted protein [Scheffersomyces stipitis CBS 6054]